MQTLTPVKAFLYKACPRCGGDLVIEAEERSTLAPTNTVDYACLQCGRRVSLETRPLAKTPAAASRAA